MGTTRKNAVDQFRNSKWAFHEINELKIKNWSLQSKLEVMGGRVTALCNEAERKDYSASKEIQDKAGKDRRIEIDLEKMKNTIKIIADQNNRMERHNAIIINAMTKKLDKAQ